jgi:hypothetical protein
MVFHKHPNAKVGLFLTKAQVEGITITVESMVDVGTKLFLKNYNMDNKLIIAIIDDDTIFHYIGENILNHLNL